MCTASARSGSAPIHTRSASCALPPDYGGPLGVSGRVDVMGAVIQSLFIGACSTLIKRDRQTCGLIGSGRNSGTLGQKHAIFWRFMSSSDAVARIHERHRNRLWSRRVLVRSQEGQLTRALELMLGRASRIGKQGREDVRRDSAVYPCDAASPFNAPSVRPRLPASSRYAEGSSRDSPECKSCMSTTPRARGLHHDASSHRALEQIILRSPTALPRCVPSTRGHHAGVTNGGKRVRDENISRGIEIHQRGDVRLTHFGAL